ncbi:E3 ubiquitin-protein ligase Midline-1-like [Ostrea edulis]|uniref:E3 ubiquitin-protein ligase Midline-1-like n=1 Tax=Ostrea edulis TaxID=37623 RepID=UPI0024AFBB9B|nr:E3 ubiquitin-protein ligase Midline-1-like [Ostrea edulis]
MLHPRRSAQEVLLCDLCETVPLQSHCEVCNINLCVNCVGKHISDSSKDHNVVPYLRRKSPNYSKCPTHPDKHCDLHCDKCEIPVCSTCALYGKHKGHDVSDIQEKLSAKTQSLQKDLEELETRIYPRYEEMASDVQTEKAELETKYGKLTTTTDQQGEIPAIVNQRKSGIAEMKNKHLSTLNKNTEEITQKMVELKQIMSDLKSILKSNDVSLTSTYKSRNSEFRTLPPKVTVPSLSAQKINKDQLNEMFGSLSPLSINTEHGDTMKSAEAVSSPPVKPLLDEPRLTAAIDTGYDNLHSVSCLSEDQVWTCSQYNKTMKLLNLQNELLTSIQTKSGYYPQDIAVTRDRDLVYTDYSDETVNLIKNKKIQTVITLQGWMPFYVCCTTSDDLLVTMDSDDYKQSKVVRYSGSTEKQSIQFDDQGRPLYSSGGYISENRNLDICVADYIARAVVVVNQSGKLRFRYTGHPSNTEQSFYPAGITTDSQSHILTADSDNHRIHILDQDGQFLRYIHCDLEYPWGLCVDIRDNLFVAEFNTAKVKKIQYL